MSEAVRRSLIAIVVFALAVVAGLLVAMLFPLNEYAILPGGTYPVSKMVSVRGNPASDQVPGPFLVYVQVERLTPLLWLAYKIKGDAQYYPITDVAGTPTGVLNQQALNQQNAWYQEESQVEAEAAAEKLAGLPVVESQQGAKVAWVDPTAPAYGRIPVGAVITSFAGHQVTTPEQLAQIEQSLPGGTLISVTYSFRGQTRTVEIPSASVAGRPYIGVGLLPSYQLAVTVRINDTVVSGGQEVELGGPSAGLAYGLYIYALTRDPTLFEGKSVAATGLLDAQGDVGPIGGLPEKAVAVMDAHIRLFLVPASQDPGSISLARKRVGSAVKIVPVATLAQAVSVIQHSE